jgi:hypothetical protein
LEDRQVTGYASAGQLRAMAITMDDDLAQEFTDEQLDALLERASADVDAWLCWPVPGDDDPAVPPCRIDVATLTKWESWVLSTSTVWQGLYRIARNEIDLLEGPPDLVSAGGLSFASQAAPLIGGMTELALSGCPTLHRYRHGLGVEEPTGAA